MFCLYRDVPATFILLACSVAFEVPSVHCQSALLRQHRLNACLFLFPGQGGNVDSTDTNGGGFPIPFPKTRHDALLFFACGVSGIYVGQFFFIVGLKETSATVSAIFQPLVPIFSVAVEIATGEERVLLVLVMVLAGDGIGAGDGDGGGAGDGAGDGVGGGGAGDDASASAGAGAGAGAAHHCPV
jgi:hypothetical protein